MGKKLIKNDNILMFFAVLILIISGLVIWRFSYVNEYEDRQSQALKIAGKATLTIDFGGGKKRAFEGDIVENETFADILSQASKAGNFYYSFDKKNNIASIDNFKNNDEKSWRFYINDKKINELPGKIIIKNDDNVFIKYE